MLQADAMTAALARVNKAPMLSVVASGEWRAAGKAVVVHHHSDDCDFSTRQSNVLPSRPTADFRGRVIYIETSAQGRSVATDSKQ
jgi:hypothetical protein